MDGQCPPGTHELQHARVPVGRCRGDVTSGCTRLSGGGGQSPPVAQRERRGVFAGEGFTRWEGGWVPVGAEIAAR